MPDLRRWNSSEYDPYLFGARPPDMDTELLLLELRDDTEALSEA